MINKLNIKNDLYEEVNKEWLKTAVIPEGKSSISSFMELSLKTDKLLMDDIDNMLNGSLKVEDDVINEFLKLYKLALDLERKDKEGVKPLLKRIEYIENIKSYKDINDNINLSDLENSIPFSFGIYDDMKDSNQNVIYLSRIDTILPNKEYYYSDKKENLLNVYAQTMKKLLSFIFEEKKADKLVADALKFDNSFVEYIKSSEEEADYSSMYNPRDLEQISKYSKHFNIDKFVKEIFSKDVTKVIVTEPRYFENMDKFLNEESFEIYKSWLIVKVVSSASSSLTEEIRQIAHNYQKALTGVEKPMETKKFYYERAKGMFSEVIGIYYAKKYFGIEAKKDVEKMVFNFIDIYKQRLENNKWLKKETIKMAIEKLNKFDVLIGYPEKYKDIYKKLKVDENLSYYENMRNLSNMFRKENYQKYNKKVDKKEWSMPADMVNAYYSPQKNLICFPAAILQEPFYSLNQSVSKNYGGIGAVIAHEISHAFDNNGAKIDKDGNLNDWWDKEDFEKFDNLCEKMIKQFDGIEMKNGIVNGKLTVSENIADNGGLSCSLEALKKLDSYNLEEFFINWARIWRNKMTDQMQALLLSSDVHSPAKLRANLQVQNIDDFYTTFNIEKGDKMYLEKEDRIIIW